jgi:hypothetical protein
MKWVAISMFVAGCGRIGFDITELAGDGPPDDPDNDGVVETEDNCPGLANADQDNEDGDAFGDACDPCPPYVVNDDPDGDGVGGLCDPRPDLSGDRIEHFAGFQRMPADLERAGTWTISGGQIHVTGSLDSLAAATWTNSGAGPEVVSTHVTIDALFGAGNARPIGVVHHFDAQSSEGTLCVFGINPSDLEVYALADNASTGAIALAPTAANVGDSSSFESRRTSTTYSCNAERLASPLQGMNVLPATNRGGLFARSGSASFDWAMVVRSP